jgi:hypothetical protein
MRQDILCRGIVRVSRVCMHSNEPFIMGYVVCVRCVPPVDTTAHRVDKAPHPARRRAAEVRSSPALPRIPELAVASAVTRVVPARARGGAPMTPATAPGERDLAPYADHRVLDRARTPPSASRGPRGRSRPATGGTCRSSAALSSALERSVMSTPEKYQSVSDTHAETPTRYG